MIWFVNERMIRRVITLGCLVCVATTGCRSVQVKKFASATRVDMTTNPGWHDFEEPFASQFARLKAKRRVVCADTAAIAAVYDIIARYEKGWVEYWAIPPESPPLVLTFHEHTQWLGTLELYPLRIGHVHNLIRRIKPDEAADIVRVLCDCDDEQRENAPG
jgi:hypothetical protein